MERERSCQRGGVILLEKEAHACGGLPHLCHVPLRPSDQRVRPPVPEDQFTRLRGVRQLVADSWAKDAKATS